MTKTEVLALLRQNKDDRGITHWQKTHAKSSLKSFGIGLTKLRKLAKEIGRDSKLATALWASDYLDAKIIAILIDDPIQMTRERAEEWVSETNVGMLSHVFASCDAPLAKTQFAFDLACDWMESTDNIRRRCGYALLYELSKKNPSGMDDEFLLKRIEHIEENIHNEEMWVREAMNTALMGIGKRNTSLNQAAIKAAKAIGPVDVDYGPDNSCEPLDVLKHLQNASLQKRLEK